MVFFSLYHSNSFNIGQKSRKRRKNEIFWRIQERVDMTLSCLHSLRQESFREDQIHEESKRENTKQEMVLTGLETLKKDQFSEESKRENTNQDIF
jgi:hypothetical protein